MRWRNSFSKSAACSKTYGILSTRARPAPRSQRANGYGDSNFARVAAAIRPAAANPLPNNASPESRIAVRSPDRKIAVALSTETEEGNPGLGDGGTLEATPSLPHAASALTINVEMCPGASSEAMIASAVSQPTSDATREVRTQCETDLAIPSTSEVRGASW